MHTLSGLLIAVLAVFPAWMLRVARNPVFVAQPLAGVCATDPDSLRPRARHVH